MCIYVGWTLRPIGKSGRAVETKLPETLDLFFFPSFHNLDFSAQKQLILAHRMVETIYVLK